MIYKIIGIGVLSVILISQIKDTRPDIALICSIASSVIILVLVLEYVGQVVSVFSAIAKQTGIDNSIFSSLIKIIGIGYVTEIAAGTLEDFGSKSIAGKIVLGGKLTILVMSMPIITALVQLLTQIVKG